MITENRALSNTDINTLLAALDYMTHCSFPGIPKKQQKHNYDVARSLITRLELRTNALNKEDLRVLYIAVQSFADYIETSHGDGSLSPELEEYRYYLPPLLNWLGPLVDSFLNE